MPDLADDWCEAKASTFLWELHILLLQFNFASFFLPGQDISFHCLAYDASFLDNHGQVFCLYVFFLYLYVSIVSKARSTPFACNRMIYGKLTSYILTGGQTHIQYNIMYWPLAKSNTLGWARSGSPNYSVVEKLRQMKLIVNWFGEMRVEHTWIISLQNGTLLNWDPKTTNDLITARYDLTATVVQ